VGVVVRSQVAMLGAQLRRDVRSRGARKKGASEEGAAETQAIP
jgi:hypothetical protein